MKKNNGLKIYDYTIGSDSLGHEISRVIVVYNGEIVYAKEDFYNIFNKNSELDERRLNKNAIYDTLEKFRDENLTEFVAICSELNNDSDIMEYVNSLINEKIGEMELMQKKLKKIKKYIEIK